MHRDDACSHPAHAEEQPPAWCWRARPDFGPWLRGQRERAGLSLREAAARAGLTYSKLQKLEAGGRVRAPSREALTALAALYGRALPDMLERAGFRVEVPPDLSDAIRCEQIFSAMVLHPALRPVCMDDHWTQAWSRLQMAQWVDFARKLEAHVLANGPVLGQITAAAEP